MYQARHDADLYRRVEVITGGRRRRNWSDEEKARIIAESADPDANILEVARRNGVNRGLLTIWRRQARTACHDMPPFARVRIEAPAGGAAADSQHAATVNDRIEIEIAGAQVRVPIGADIATLRSVFVALRFVR